MPKYVVEVFVDDDSEGTYFVHAADRAEAEDEAMAAVRERSLRCTIREATDEDDELDFDWVLGEED